MRWCPLRPPGAGVDMAVGAALGPEPRRPPGMDRWTGGVCAPARRTTVPTGLRSTASRTAPPATGSVQLIVNHPSDHHRGRPRPLCRSPVDHRVRGQALGRGRSTIMTVCGEFGSSFDCSKSTAAMAKVLGAKATLARLMNDPLDDAAKLHRRLWLPTTTCCGGVTAAPTSTTPEACSTICSRARPRPGTGTTETSLPGDPSRSSCATTSAWEKLPPR